MKKRKGRRGRRRKRRGKREEYEEVEEEERVEEEKEEEKKEEEKEVNKQAPQKWGKTPRQTREGLRSTVYHETKETTASEVSLSGTSKIPERGIKVSYLEKNSAEANNPASGTRIPDESKTKRTIEV